MPIYEYRCEKGHTFEVLQRMSDEPLHTCETCGAHAVRVLHAPAVHFKGSGFYNTDYGTKKRAREKSAESNGDGKSGDGKSGERKSGEGKSGDAKPDAGTAKKKADTSPAPSTGS